MRSMPSRRRSLLAFSASLTAGALTLAVMAAPASAQAAGTSAVPRLEVIGAPASYDQPYSLELLLEVLGLSVQVSNGYVGATGPASLVQVACALPLSETDGLGSLCVYTGDNETGDGLIFFPGDSVPSGTCMYIYGDIDNFGDNTNQSWDLGTSVDHDCQGGGTVDALDQSGQDQNVSPVDYGAVAVQFNLSAGSPFAGEPEDAEWYGG
jgi:hypothetical protein